MVITKHLLSSGTGEIDDVTLHSNTISSAAVDANINLASSGASSKVIVEQPIIMGDIEIRDQTISALDSSMDVVIHAADTSSRAILGSRTQVNNLFIEDNVISTTNANGNLIFDTSSGQGKITATRAHLAAFSLDGDKIEVNSNVPDNNFNLVPSADGNVIMSNLQVDS